MRDDRHGSFAEIAAERILEGAVGLGNAFVLPQMLEPGSRNKHFDVAIWDFGIAEKMPLNGAVAKTAQTEFAHGIQEIRFAGGVDVVFHRNHGRSLIPVLRDVETRLGPMVRRCGVDILNGLKRKTQIGAHPQDDGHGRNANGCRHAEGASDSTPDNAADGGRAEKDDQIKRQGPAANPAGGDGLHRHIDGRQHRDPGRAAYQHGQGQERDETSPGGR